MSDDFSVYRIPIGVDIDTAHWSMKPGVEMELIFSTNGEPSFNNFVHSLWQEKDKRLNDGSLFIQCFMEDFTTGEGKRLLVEGSEVLHSISSEEYTDLMEELFNSEQEKAEYYLVCCLI